MVNLYMGVTHGAPRTVPTGRSSPSSTQLSPRAPSLRHETSTRFLNSAIALEKYAAAPRNRWPAFTSAPIYAAQAAWI